MISITRDQPALDDEPVVVIRLPMVRPKGGKNSHQAWSKDDDVCLIKAIGDDWKNFDCKYSSTMHIGCLSMLVFGMLMICMILT